MSQSNKLPTLGIFGGTFDPIHYGHLNPAKEAAKILGLQQVHFVPAADPPHRAIPVADSQHRLAMVRLALKDYPEFIADDREIRREGKSYTVDTLKSFREEFGKDISIMIFIGADAFGEINTWHQWQHIPDLAHIIVIARPDCSFVKLSALAGLAKEKMPDWSECKNINQLYKQAHGLVFFQTVDPVNVSATKIRSLLASDKKNENELLQVMPPEVYAYINKHNLYLQSNGD